MSVSVVFAAAFTDRYLWIADPNDNMPFAWRVSHDPLRLVAEAFVVLIPFSWWLLIERTVHAETLIGDKQFWITRPIDWKSLLSAKLLFLLAFLYLPFAIAQCIELNRAGFPILPALPGLLFLLILVTGILVVPLLTLAVLTRNFSRLLLTLLGLLLAVGAIAYVANKFDSNSVSTPYSDRFSIPILLVFAGFAIVFQYARRKTWLARAVLLPLPLVIALIATFMPNRSMVESAYPRPDHLAAEPVLLTSTSGTFMRQGSDDGIFELVFPMNAEGVASNHAVLIDNILATIEDASWTSDWQAVYNHNVLPGNYHTELVVHLKSKDYERLRTAPHTLKLHFALTEVQAGHVTTIDHPNQNFSISSFGICAPSVMSRYFDDNRSILCRTALHGPDLTFIRTTGSTTGCDAQASQDDVPLGAWEGSLDNDPAEFGLTSVWNHSIYFANLSADTKVSRCPDRPLRFTQYTLVRRTQTELTVPNFRFPAPASNTFILAPRIP
ncbi:MAG TPA: hypothetical protein VHW46_04655 [Terracidiphilus sp.]|nr:hypothetical protein [Terracidiphilus sp.]